MTTPKPKPKPKPAAPAEDVRPLSDPTDPTDNSIGWAVYDATLGQYLTGVIHDQDDAQAWLDAAATPHTLQVHRV
jgi:hypothetical protein